MNRWNDVWGTARTKILDGRGGLVLGVGIAVSASVVALAMIFASAQGSTAIAERGTVGMYTESALSAAAATRNQAVQAMVIKAAWSVHAASAEELALVTGAAARGAAELDTRITRLIESTLAPSQKAFIKTAAAEFDAALDTVLEEITRGDLEAEHVTELDASYLVLTHALARERDDVYSELALAREDAGQIADASRFLVACLIPLAAVLVYRRSVRHQQRRQEIEHELTRKETIIKTKDEFITNLSHELRTPLTSIYGFGSAMLEEQIQNQPGLIKEMATLIVAESSELSRMVDDLLTAARVEHNDLTFQIEAVDPTTELEAVLSPLRAIGWSIRYRLSEGMIQADPLRLRQVLRNLVSNAFKHGAAPVAVTGRVDGSCYIFAVTDSGPGVPAELEDRLFTRFVHQGQAPILTGSVGLGLALAKFLAVEMGGDVTYRRTGGLTTFEARLPLGTVAEAVELDGQLLTL